MLSIIYILGMVLHYGVLFAFWQRNWPSLAEIDYFKDILVSGLFAIIWPAIMLISVIVRDNIYKYGLKFW